MDGTVKILGWIIAVIAIILAVVGWTSRATLQNEVTALRAQNESMSQQLALMDELEEQVREQERFIDELSNEITRLGNRLENAMTNTPGGALPEAADTELSPTMMQDLFSGMLGGMDAPPEGMEELMGEDFDFDSPEGQEAMQELIQSMSDNEGMQRVQSNMMINLQYAPLLNEMQLSSEKEEAVRDILAMHAREEMQRGLDMMGSGELPTGQDMQAREDEALERLLDDLAGVLDADELAAFEAYEQDKEFYTLQQSFDMQLGMFGSGMQAETREIAREILAEETLNAQEVMRQSDEPMNPGQAMEHNIAAMENARARLEGALSPEEFRKVDNFITDMNELYESSMGMFGNLDTAEGSSE